MVDREDNRSRNLSVAAVFTRLTGEAIKKRKITQKQVERANLSL